MRVNKIPSFFCYLKNLNYISIIMGKKLTKDEFIERANKVHKSKYIYYGEYINGSTKIDICCPIHGIFKQTPYHHLHGQGCPKCAVTKNVERQKLTYDSFIKRSKQIHGDKYDYSKIEYKTYKSKVCIICPKHGEFWQTPDSHLHKHGCPKCAGKLRTKEDFIEDSIKLHGNNINYDNVVYKGVHTKVLLKCNICQREFYQTPHDHLQGKGCPHCNESKLEKEVAKFLDKKQIKYERWYRYDTIRNKSTLDFYLPKYKVGVECQGEQHFKPIKFRGNMYEEWAENEFEKNLMRDKRKFDKCNELKIKLFYYIPNVKEEYIENEKYNNIYTKNNIISKVEELNIIWEKS